MTTVSLPQIPRTDLLTHSRLSTFRTCRRRHMFRYTQGLVSTGTRRPLRLGSAFHLGLELAAKGTEPEAAITQAVETCFDKPPAAPEQLYLCECDREVVIQMLRGYFWRWWTVDELPPELTIQSWVAVEREFEIPLRNPESGRSTSNFKMGGKIDGIARLADGQLAVVEHKTTAQNIEPESDYWRTLDIDPQISGYYIAARDLGFNVTTVLYDVARKPTIQPGMVAVKDDDDLPIVIDDATGERAFKKDGTPYKSAGAGRTALRRAETPQEFAERFRKQMSDDPLRFFQRRQIPRLESDLDDYRAELWQTQQDLRQCERENRWWRNTQVCKLPFPCDYAPICATHQPDSAVPSGFRRTEQLHPELNGDQDASEG